MVRTMDRAATEPRPPSHGRQAAGLRSEFLPAGGFQGPKAGYEFKRGDQGPGYYRVHELASRQDFLAALEQAEARDSEALSAAMATGFGGVEQQRQWQQQQPFHAAYRQREVYARNAHVQQPEWARVGVSESTLAFQRPDEEQLVLTGFERAGPSRSQRVPFKPIASQISLAHGPPPPPDVYERKTMPLMEQKRGRVDPAARPVAGGRPNMSGPADPRTGVGTTLLANSVNFLTT